MAVLGLVFLCMVFIFWILSQPGRIERLVRTAISLGNTNPLLDELLSRPEELQGRALDQMMGRLWEESELILAVQLVERYLQEEKKSAAGHRWVKNLLEKESILSRQYFSSDFLKESYNPNMAANCAPGG